MIHPDCKYLDIYPYTWRNLGQLMDFLIPSKNILYILHEKGHYKSAACSDNTRFPLPSGTYCASSFDAGKLFAEHPEIGEIHVFEEAALLHYYCAAQTVSLDEKNTMEYLDFITDYYNHHKGIDIYRKSLSSGTTFYRKCLDYAQKNLEEKQIILFLVTRQSFLWFDVVLLVENGIITEIRTLDTLHDESFYGNPFDRQQEAATLLSSQFQRAVKIIHYEYEELSSITRFWDTYHT